jgi:hypothetical protein
MSYQSAEIEKDRQHDLLWRIEQLEDLEDAEEIRRLRKAGEEAVPWEQAKAELRGEGIDVSRSIA